MTAVALTAANISLCDPDWAEVYPVTVAEAVTAGLAAYQLAAGTFGIADANASGKQQFRGIFLRPAAAGQTTDLLVRGRCYGFTVSGLSGDDPLYLSDTVGSLDTAAGTMTVICARVVALTNVGTLTKVIYVDADWNRIWS